MLPAGPAAVAVGLGVGVDVGCNTVAVAVGGGDVAVALGEGVLVGSASTTSRTACERCASPLSARKDTSPGAFFDRDQSEPVQDAHGFANHRTADLEFFSQIQFRRQTLPLFQLAT